MAVVFVCVLLLQQALLERRLCSLSAFQQRLRRNILREAQQQSLPLAELLLEPQAPRSVHEQALSCGCCCISCCKGRPPNAAATSAAVADDAQASAARVAGGATTGGTTAAGTTPATVTATVGLPTPATTTGATGTAVLPFPVSCCGCCCDTSCASFAASTAPSSVVSSCVSTAPAGPQQGAAARAALFAALDPLGLADVEGSELAQKAQRVSYPDDQNHSLVTKLPDKRRLSSEKGAYPFKRAFWSSLTFWHK